LSSHRKIALVTGVLFVITFVTSIPPFVFLYVPVVDDPRYILGGGADNLVLLGAFLELLLIIANIGTAVVLYPVLKRVNEILALGYVTARVVECVFIAVGILSLLTVVTLRQEATAGADAASLVAVGESLVALHDWTFLLGPGFFVGVGNGLILGYLMYTSALVPRGMAMLGLIGGTLIIASGVGVLFGVIEAGGVAAHRDHPGVPLEVVRSRHMAHREGIQSICDRSLTARITVGELSDGIRHARRSLGGQRR
jgi:hypothetical protein